MWFMERTSSYTAIQSPDHHRDGRKDIEPVCFVAWAAVFVPADNEDHCHVYVFCKRVGPHISALFGFKI